MGCPVDPGPVQWWRVSRPLPRWQRYTSDLAIAALILGGASALEQGRPEWTFYVAALCGPVATAVAQGLAVRALPAPGRSLRLAAPQWPELPGLECQSLRGAPASLRARAIASSPAGLMSA
jgi:hypothetical protein